MRHLSISKKIETLNLIQKGKIRSLPAIWPRAEHIEHDYQEWAKIREWIWKEQQLNQTKHLKFARHGDLEWTVIKWKTNQHGLRKQHILGWASCAWKGNGIRRTEGFDGFSNDAGMAHALHCQWYRVTQKKIYRCKSTEISWISHLQKLETQCKKPHINKC